MKRLLLVLVFTGIAGAAAAAESDELRARVIDSDSQRTPVLTIAPEYPRKARRDRIEGEVQVCFDVDRKGRPHRVAVRRSSNRAFERPAIRAVRASAFEPLADDETNPAIKTCRLFIFALVRESD